MAAESSLRVLFVSPSHDVYAPTTGTGTRLRSLAERVGRTQDVAVLSPASFDATGADWVDATYDFRRVGPGYLTDCNPHFAAAVRDVLASEAPDVVHVALPKGVCATKAAARSLGRDVPVVYGAQNLEATHAKDVSDPSLPWYKRAVGPRLIPLVERLSVRCADYLTTVSEDDRDAFVSRYGLDGRRVRAIPSGAELVDTGAFRPVEDRRRELGLDADTVCVFHGSFSHPPNREAASLLVERIVPALRDRGRDVQLLLVGEGAPEVSDDAVRTAGFVEDLLPVLDAADVAVMPIRHGGGTKTKLFDYMSVGLPVVTTEKGAQGVRLEHGTHAMIAPDADGRFVDAVAEVAADDALARRLSTNLRSLAEERYNWDRSADSLASFYGTIAADR